MMTAELNITVTGVGRGVTLGDLRELVRAGRGLPDEHPVRVSQTGGDPRDRGETRISLSKAAERRTVEGNRPTFAVRNETHHWPNLASGPSARGDDL